MTNVERNQTCKKLGWRSATFFFFSASGYRTIPQGHEKTTPASLEDGTYIWCHWCSPGLGTNEVLGWNKFPRRSGMTESPKINVEYVLFDMDGLLLINTFFNYSLTHILSLLIDSERIYSIVTSTSIGFFYRGRKSFDR
jgi:hypothetical protein